MGNAVGLRPKRRCLKRGEKVGGVCPKDKKWAVRHAERGNIDDNLLRPKFFFLADSSDHM